MSDNGFHEMAHCPDCRKIGRLASTALGNPTPVELDTREATEVGLVRMLAARLEDAERLLHEIRDDHQTAHWHDDIDLFLDSTPETVTAGEVKP